MGRLLRRSSIDELPQLFSVLRGHMSCVGPRPIVSEEVARYGRYWKHYIKTRPGLTGAWQVSGRNRLSYQPACGAGRPLCAQVVASWRDLVILLKTIPAVLRTDDTASERSTAHGGEEPKQIRGLLNRQQQNKNPDRVGDGPAGLDRHRHRRGAEEGRGCQKQRHAEAHADGQSEPAAARHAHNTFVPSRDSRNSLNTVGLLPDLQ